MHKIEQSKKHSLIAYLRSVLASTRIETQLKKILQIEGMPLALIRLAPGEKYSGKLIG